MSVLIHLTLHECRSMGGKWNNGKLALSQFASCLYYCSYVLKALTVTSIMASLSLIGYYDMQQLSSLQLSQVLDTQTFKVPGSLFEPALDFTHLTISLPWIALTGPTGTPPLHSLWAKQYVGTKVLSEAQKSLLPKR